MMQLSFFKFNKPKEGLAKTCAFTGHRNLEEDFSISKLRKQIKYLILDGVDTFYNGMAIGFDLAAAEVVLSLKKKYKHIKIIACIPCYEQEKYYSNEDKLRYVNILKEVDEKIILSNHYYNGCMQKRDRFMVDKADYLITYCRQSTGGTAYTVNYFIKQKGEGNIIYL